ncbi:MAG TPA: hypothetical protein VNB94_08240 [Mycobacteriales bacterium]|nr:hypothetical protein [Mycobacteriales bacterium]
MATLHIEHAITDLATWLGAFNTFAETRAGAGVRSERVHQPADDEKYIYVQLDFDDVPAAEAFLGFLERVVLASADASPALVGSPRGRVLEYVAT